MILGDYYIFYRMPKAAGTFIQNFLVQHLNGITNSAIDGSHHVAIRHTPECHKGKKSFGIIRNPWDWYVSNFFYLKKIGKDTPFFRAYSGGKNIKEATFIDSIQLCTLGKQAPQWAMHIARPRYGINIAENVIKKWDFGHITMMYILHFFDDIERAFNNSTSYLIKHHDELLSVDKIFKMENMKEEVPEWLMLSDDKKLIFFNEKAINTSQHDNYSQYYTIKTKKKVAKSEQLITEIYNYKFED